MTIARTYMTHKLRDLSLFRENNLTTTLSCFPMKLDDVRTCPVVEFKRCETLMRSQHPLPDPIFSRHGAAIIKVVSLDDSIEFNKGDLTSLANNRLRAFSKYTYEYYVKDNYLYIPNREVYSVDVVLITQDVKKANDLSECGQEDRCKSIWEYNFICPDSLLEQVIKATLQEITSTRKQIVEDENPNLDNTQKSQTKV